MQLVRLCEVDVLYEFLQYTGTSVMANNSDNARRRTLQYPQRVAVKGPGYLRGPVHGDVSKRCVHRGVLT